MEFLQSLYSLEINGCNEITEQVSCDWRRAGHVTSCSPLIGQGLWSSLHPRLVSLTVADCINVADECICAITQLLPALYEFNLQVRCRKYYFEHYVRKLSRNILNKYL